jgi:ferredoxin
MPRSSTRKFFHAHGWRNFFNFVHGYIFVRWTNQYVKLLTLLPTPGWMKKPLADRYHGKVLTTDLAREVINLDQDIPLRDLEQIIPYATARDLVLDGPPDIAIYECCCRSTREKSCQPTQVCMVIGQPMVNLMLEHNPKSSRRITQTEALEILEAERRRGHVHSAWFKDAMLGRFYAICNCCKCCCQAIAAKTRHDMPLMTSSGFFAKVGSELCTSCGVCEETCPFGAIKLVDQMAVVSWEMCMGCGACTAKCPRQAIVLARDERKGRPLDVRELIEEHVSK